MVEVANEYGDELPTDSFDVLDNYISTLTGDVAPEYFVRFPGESENLAEFIEYVRGRQWMR